VEFTGLKRSERLSDLRPGLLARELDHPFDEESEGTDLHVGLNAVWEPVVHRLHLNAGSFERSKAPLDDKEPLVTCSSVFKGDRVVVGLEHPFAIEFGRFTNGPSLETNAACLVDGEIALVAT